MGGSAMGRNLGPMVRIAALGLVLGTGVLPREGHAEIDGHGPDAWRVTGVAADDVLNARMGPGTRYPVIETFGHDEGGLQQVTCVPFYTMKHFSAMTQAEHDSLPAPWCLMRSEDMARAGWVAQRFLVADYAGEADASGDVVDIMKILPAPTAGPDAWSSDDLIDYAQGLVATLYEYDDPAQGRSHVDPTARDIFFSADFVSAMQSRPPGADLLVGAQDFEGSISQPQPDPDQPMFRGMITINVEIENFGRTHLAVFRLRGDTARPGAPLRIFRIEHDEWSYP